MFEFANLEIGLSRQDLDTYTVELRFWQPDDQADPAPVYGEAKFNITELKKKRLQPPEYGLLLSQSLFHDQKVLGKFREACAATGNRTLRVRLYIDRSVPELQNLYWETLRDPCDDSWPQDGPWLATSRNILLSRYGRSSDWWRTVQLRPKGSLRALVFIANPIDLANPQNTPQLAPVDVQGELNRAREALKPIQSDELYSDPADPGRASLNNLIARLDAGYDIVYLVCHGALVRGEPQGKLEPYLWLEKEDGSSDRVTGADLVNRLNDMRMRPLLMVLASCQSAGDGGQLQSKDEGALAALGPMLEEVVGIPSVLAMQGNVTMNTITKFMPEFFKGLCEHGQIDLALAKARDMVRDREDWWMPVLFMRLRLGQIWYEPHFAAVQPGFDTWEDLTSAIREETCTPILGPGLIEFLIGTPQEIAWQWSKSKQFPMDPHNRSNWPQVARYLAITQSPAFPRSALIHHLQSEIQRRQKDKLQGAPGSASLDRLVSLVGEKCRQANEAEPYRVLSRLPVKIYINANPDSLLFDALKEVGKAPRVALCPWNTEIEQPDWDHRKEQDYIPSKEEPLIYYLFGRLDQPASLVISDDDYFNYLIWISKEQVRPQPDIPLVVSAAWITNAQIFLGFQIDDWEFRVLLHSITNLDGGRKMRHNSVAVQVTPDEGPFLQPEMARRYLEKYLEKYLGGVRNMTTNMYWGSVQDFVREMWQRRHEWQ